MKETYVANYFVNEQGDVLNKRGNKLAKQVNRDGYLTVNLWTNNRQKKYAVHRLVARTLIPNPKNKPCVNHIDGNKQNNSVENLEWVTYSENTVHALELGLKVIQKGSEVHNSTITETEAHEICRLMQQGFRNIDIHDSLGVSKNVLKDIRQKRTWLHVSSNYDIPNKSRTLSKETIVWICLMIQDGFTNSEILEYRKDDKVTKTLISKIKNRKLYTDITNQYNF